MKQSTIVVLILNFVVWGGLACLSQNLLVGNRIAERGNLDQMEYYLAFSLIMLSVSTLPTALLSRTQWATYGNAWSLFALLLLLPYSCFYTGGM